MARVTVEDCITRVPNRFELVLVAAQRARDISAGSALAIERDDDKNPVVALREIAEDQIDVGQLQNALVTGLQRQPEIDEPEEDHDLAIDAGWPATASEEALADDLKDDMLLVDEEGNEVEPESEPEAGTDFGDDFSETSMDDAG